MSVHGPEFFDRASNTRYAPGRDFAFVIPEMIASVCYAIEREYWPEMYPLCEKLFLLDKPDGDFLEEMKRTRDVYCRYIEHACDTPTEGVEDVFQKTGWNECHVAARMLWAALLGAVVSGQLLAGLRDITPENGPLPPHVRVSLCEIREGGIRAFNGVTRTEGLAGRLRETVQMCRNAGFTYEEIVQIARSVVFGQA